MAFAFDALAKSAAISRVMVSLGRQCRLLDDGDVGAGAEGIICHRGKHQGRHCQPILVSVTTYATAAKNAEQRSCVRCHASGEVETRMSNGNGTAHEPSTVFRGLFGCLSASRKTSQQPSFQWMQRIQSPRTREVVSALKLALGRTLKRRRWRWFLGKSAARSRTSTSI